MPAASFRNNSTAEFPFTSASARTAWLGRTRLANADNAGLRLVKADDVPGIGFHPRDQMVELIEL